MIVWGSSVWVNIIGCVLVGGMAVSAFTFLIGLPWEVITWHMWCSRSAARHGQEARDRDLAEKAFLERARARGDWRY